jgi:hypothetical protein
MDIEDKTSVADIRRLEVENASPSLGYSCLNAEIIIDHWEQVRTKLRPKLY